MPPYLVPRLPMAQDDSFPFFPPKVLKCFYNVVVPRCQGLSDVL